MIWSILAGRAGKGLAGAAGWYRAKHAVIHDGDVNRVRTLTLHF
jgi:hypothetical protein